MPYSVQLPGFVATLVGTCAGIASCAFAVAAARRAKGAREQAELARQAATRLGRIARLGDLIADMQELQTMLARADFLAVATKANLLRGRIVRFKQEAYTEIGAEEQEDLDLARDQLEVIVSFIHRSKARDEYKASRIQAAYGDANEALNRVFALHGQNVRGD